MTIADCLAQARLLGDGYQLAITRLPTSSGGHRSTSSEP